MGCLGCRTFILGDVAVIQLCFHVVRHRCPFLQQLLPERKILLQLLSTALQPSQLHGAAIIDPGACLLPCNGCRCNPLFLAHLFWPGWELHSDSDSTQQV